MDPPCVGGRIISVVVFPINPEALAPRPHRFQPTRETIQASPLFCNGDSTPTPMFVACGMRVVATGEHSSINAIKPDELRVARAAVLECCADRWPIAAGLFAGSISAYPPT